MKFEGKLKSNEIFGALFNMIISQEVFADNIKGDDLVSKAKVDGTLYGDTKLYYATDALKSSAWGNDAEAANLLALHRPKAPECQEITLDKFRQICLTVDDYLSKRAWGTEGAFSSFNSVMLGWIGETKKIYDGTTYNVFIGTTLTKEGKQYQTVSADVAEDAAKTGQAIADIVTEMTDYNRDFNDYACLRRYSAGELTFIFNSKYLNKFKNIDLPTIFHNEGLEGKFNKTSLAPRYFGTVNTAAKTADGTATRSLIEQEIGTSHYFAGDLITKGEVAPAGTSYQEDANVICKIYVKLPPYMSAFEVGTSFFNPKSLTENHYLTFGHNTLEYLKGYPCVTIVKASA